MDSIHWNILYGYFPKKQEVFTTGILYHVYPLINFVEKRKLVNWNNKIILLSWIHPLSHLWHQWTFGYFNVYWKIKKNTLNAQIHHNCHYKTCDGTMFVKTRVSF